MIKGLSALLSYQSMENQQQSKISGQAFRQAEDRPEARLDPIEYYARLQ